MELPLAQVHSDGDHVRNQVTAVRVLRPTKLENPHHLGRI
jgi:hypothetical protein